MEGVHKVVREGIMDCNVLVCIRKRVLLLLLQSFNEVYRKEGKYLLMNKTR